jgi:hypothetical protein
MPNSINLTELAPKSFMRLILEDQIIRADLTLPNSPISANEWD